MSNALHAFLRDERGTTSIEYALIGFFLSILIVGGVRAIGGKLSSNYYGPISGQLT